MCCEDSRVLTYSDQDMDQESVKGGTGAIRMVRCERFSSGAGDGICIVYGTLFDLVWAPLARQKAPPVGAAACV